MFMCEECTLDDDFCDDCLTLFSDYFYYDDIPFLEYYEEEEGEEDYE